MPTGSLAKRASIPAAPPPTRPPSPTIPWATPSRFPRGANGRLRTTVDGATTTYTYNELDQLLAAGGASFAYDAPGNLTQSLSAADVTTQAWDALDRLSSAILPDGTSLAYAYDTDSRRVHP